MNLIDAFAAIIFAFAEFGMCWGIALILDGISQLFIMKGDGKDEL